MRKRMSIGTKTLEKKSIEYFYPDMYEKNHFTQIKFFNRN